MRVSRLISRSRNSSNSNNSLNRISSNCSLSQFSNHNRNQDNGAGAHGLKIEEEAVTPGEREVEPRPSEEGAEDDEDCPEHEKDREERDGEGSALMVAGYCFSWWSNEQLRKRAARKEKARIEREERSWQAT